MSIQQHQNKGIEAFTGAATLILIKTMGFPIMRHVRVVKAETRANQHNRQTLVLVYVEQGKRLSLLKLQMPLFFYSLQRLQWDIACASF